MAAEKTYIKAALGEGIFLIKDVSKILDLDYEKVYRWIVSYWGNDLNDEVVYTFGEDDNRAINFYSLIEFYTFFKLREKGLSTTEIKNFHAELSKILNSKYPFAIAQDYFIEQRKVKRKKTSQMGILPPKIKKFIYYTYFDSLIKFDSKKQFSLKFMEKFLDKIEFDENNLAAKFYPLTNSKNIVVDPKHQFGQPVVTGTNIKTQTLFNLYNGGETLENISILYNISTDKVKDAITFQNAA
jgi:uncharacterized protein (DUF433 family)